MSETLPTPGQTGWAGPLNTVLGDLDNRLSYVEAVINVKAFGAKGDGSTDDTTAIVAAITAFKSGVYIGRAVYFPTGVYKISSQIDIGNCSNIVLRGDGADSSYFTCTTAINSAFYASATISNVRFTDLGWNGGVATPVSVPTRTRTVSAGFSHAVELDGSLVPTESNPIMSNVTFSRCRVTNTSSLPVFFRGIGGYTRILDSVFDNCMDVGLIYCADVEVRGNKSLNSQDNGFSISRGCRKAVVANNRVDGCAYHGVWISGFVIDAGGGTPGTGSDIGPQDFVCSGNIVTNSGRSGIALIDAPKWGTVTGNIVDTVSRGDLSAPSDSYGLGILVQGYPDTLPAAPTDYAEGLTIGNNTLLNCAKGGIFLKGAVRNSRINDNTMINCGSQFKADGTTSLFHDTSDSLNNFGISADNISTHSNLEIMDNIVIDSRGTVYCNWSVSVSTSISGARMLGNRGINTYDVTRGSNPSESFDTWYAAKNINGLFTATAGIRVGSSAGTTNLFSRIDGAAGNARRFVLGTGSQLDRWALTANGTAEGGSNAGSDLELRSYNDAGSFLATYLTVTRSNGLMTFGDAVNFALGTTTGTKIGTGTTQKLGFFNATPVVQQTNTTDVKTALQNLGLIATGGNALIATTTPVVDATGAGTAGSLGTASDAGHAHPNYDWLPSDHGYVSWTYDPVYINTGTAQTTGGVLTLVKLKVPAAVTATNIVIYLGTLGSGLTSSQNFLGLYNSSGTLLSATADQTTTWNTGGTTGVKSTALTASQSLSAGTTVYVGILTNGTTQPQFGRTGFASGVGNAGLSGASLKFGTILTGQTSMPGSFTPSSVASSTLPIWAALS